MSDGGGWRRLHPLSPVVRAGRGTIAVFVVLAPALLGGRSFTDSYVQFAVVGVVFLLGFVSWLVTRWRIDGDDLRIETGLLKRQSLRYPLAQVQAIDIVRPGLARIVKVAELRLRMGGATGGTARLAYLNEREAEPLRDRLLALAHGGGDALDVTPDAGPGGTPAGDETVLASVPTGRLAASILVSDVGLAAEAVLTALIVTAFLAPAAAGGILGGGVAEVIAVGTLVWRRFNQEYRLTVAAADDGLRLHSGLVALNHETIRPGRVQAIRLVEPLLWRRLGWCRLEVDLAGHQKRKGEGEATRGQLRALLPVGRRADARALLEHVLPNAPRADRRPPRRVRAKSPLRYRFLAWGMSEQAVVTVSGRLRRVTVWVPLEKVQSLRLVEGPVQRRLRLASIHVDVAGRALHGSLRDRDRGEADRALGALVDGARAARARTTRRAQR